MGRYTHTRKIGGSNPVIIPYKVKRCIFTTLYYVIIRVTARRFLASGVQFVLTGATSRFVLLLNPFIERDIFRSGTR